jgi:phosphate transport system protein
MRHFQLELDELQSRLLAMAGLVESAIAASIRSVVESNTSAIQDVFALEPRINRMEVDVDDYAVRLLALYQPTAKDLRFLTAVIKITSDLERMGDHAVNIVQRAQSLGEARIEPMALVARMGELSAGMVKQCLHALFARDAAEARSVLEEDDAVDELKNKSQEDFVQLIQRSPASARGGLDMILVARNLERIADLATNIAEDVLYVLEGVDVRHSGDNLKILKTAATKPEGTGHPN